MEDLLNIFASTQRNVLRIPDNIDWEIAAVFL
jgi:hypothetical protein